MRLRVLVVHRHDRLVLRRDVRREPVDERRVDERRVAGDGEHPLGAHLAQRREQARERPAQRPAVDDLRRVDVRAISGASAPLVDSHVSRPGETLR